MSKKNVYLERYAYPDTFINEKPHDGLQTVVVLPSYNEPRLTDSLEALHACQATEFPLEVLVVINEGCHVSEAVRKQNRQSCKEARQWAEAHSTPEKRYHIVFADGLPKKHAGVGLARKIGMDEAVRRLEAVGQTKGILLCFDADSLCEPNYLREVEQFFVHKKPQANGCSIHYEHPLTEEYPEEVIEGIISYELHLRYYVNGLRYAGHPFAYQTIGSSMAVRSDVYQKQGGMNRRKAGEDFYFLQRIIPLGKFYDLNTTCVIPSPRESDRVPFGTGRAIQEWLSNRKNIHDTYDFRTFEDLREAVASCDSFYKTDSLSDAYERLPLSFQAFWEKELWIEQISGIINDSPGIETFRKKFFHWFDAFQVLKYAHFARDHFYPLLTVNEGLRWLFEAYIKQKPADSLKKQLFQLREFDKSNLYPTSKQA
ncbi:MAG: hypothetical protein MI784_07085 [Cytophagales bacterium]|nr:hypothetical protein [Cytophagales bacterium]